MVEREAPGGQAGTSSRIENYLGFPSGVSGDELASRALQQARRLGAEILVTRSITRIDAATRQVHLDGGDVLRARTIILACGVSWRHLADRGLRPARREGHLLRRGAQRGVEHPRAGRPHRRCGQLGGAGGTVLLHPRAKRDDPLPRRQRSRRACRATSSTSSRRGRTSRVMFGAEVAAVHGDASLEAIEVRDTATGRDDQARFGRTVHLHRGRRRDGMAAARDRARPQRLRAHGLRRARRGRAGSSTATPTSWRRAFRASSPVAMSGSVP